MSLFLDTWNLLFLIHFKYVNFFSWSNVRTYNFWYFDIKFSHSHGLQNSSVFLHAQSYVARLICMTRTIHNCGKDSWSITKSLLTVGFLNRSLSTSLLFLVFSLYCVYMMVCLVCSYWHMVCLILLYDELH